MAELNEDYRARHPDYVHRAPEWRLVRHSARGQTAIQEAGEEYLPMPSGFAGQDDKGVAMYSAYIKRAAFPEMVTPTVVGLCGLVSRREFECKLPAEMEYLWERATPDGLPLEALHRRMLSEVMLMGRCALLPDVDEEGVPRIGMYAAEALTNWSKQRDMYVLDESGPKRNGFTWQHHETYRALLLESGVYVQRTYDAQTGTENTITPTVRGGRPLEEIPLVVVGSRDLALDPDDPPMLPLARICVSMYRLDADYRHQLFMSGQETLAVFGVQEDENLPDIVGAGVILGLPQDARAEYVSPKCSGIQALRTALVDSRDDAALAGARILDAGRKTPESGEALRLRARARSATTVSVTLAAAQGLERVLRAIARMLGVAKPDDIDVIANLDFLDSELAPSEAVNLMQLWQAGAISYETFYAAMQRGGIASQERDSAEEQRIYRSGPRAPAPAPAAATGATPAPTSTPEGTQ